MAAKSQEVRGVCTDEGLLRAGDSTAVARCERILEAAERLFAERAFETVSVRDIASAAGVTHPLIYYYWGSKEDLLAAVLDRHQARMRRVAGDLETEARALIDALVRENLSGSRQYLLTVTRAFLDGMKPSEWPGGYPGVEAALASLKRACADADDPERDHALREVLMTVVAMMIGWIMLEEPLLTIVGLSAGDRQEAREQMLASIQRMLDQVLPPDAG